MNEWRFFVLNGWIQGGRIQDGRMQDGWHHQVNQIDLVWVRVRVEWECFWVNLREDDKVFESKMAVSESNMAEFKMAVIIKLNQNEWVKFFFCKMAELKMAKFKMVASSSWVRMNEFEAYSISLSQSQSGVRVFLSESERGWQGVWIQDGSVWIQHGRIQDGCHHQVESEWMSEVLFCAKWLNPRWHSSKWLPSSSWVRMIKWSFFCAKWLNWR